MANCPLTANQYGTRHSCLEDCAFYDNGCLVAKALKTYIKVNSPITAYSEKSEGRIRDRDTANLDYLAKAGPIGYD